MIRTFPQHHGMREPALLIQPEVRLRGQISHAPLLKELGSNVRAGGFVGHVLRAFFAELKVRALAIWFRPGTTGTVNAILLIELKQGARPADHAHLAESEPGRGQCRGHAPRDFTDRLNFRWR